MARQKVGKARAAMKEATKHMHRSDAIRVQLQDIYGEFVHCSKNPSGLKRRLQGYRGSVLQFMREGTQWIKYQEGHNMEYEEGHADGWTGLLHELTTLALLNRVGGPLPLALPALQHHDQNQYRPYSYDVLLIANDAYSMSPSLIPIQVKSNSQYKGRDSDYGSSVFVLYATQWFGYSHGQSGERLFPVANLLIDEHAGNISSEYSAYLDRITNQLVLEAASSISQRVTA
jgi:hypothetical protein